MSLVAFELAFLGWLNVALEWSMCPDVSSSGIGHSMNKNVETHQAHPN